MSNIGKGLITTGYHIPYNPQLKQRGRELRKNMTKSEQKLWQDFLRYFQFQFYRQKPIDNYIVDFYCPKLKLVIEIDGKQHEQMDNKIYDENRKHILNGFGLTELRFSNEEVLYNFNDVCKRIEKCNRPKSPFK